MTLRSLPFALVVALVLGAALVRARVEAAPAPDTPAQLLEAAKKLDADFVAAFNRGDVDAVMAHYWKSPELTIYPPDTMELLGWEAGKKGFAEMAVNMKGAQLAMKDPKNRVAGEVVLGSGRWTLTMTGPDGKPMVLEGRYSDVKEKKDGRWVYTVDHASAPLPPPSAK